MTAFKSRPLFPIIAVAAILLTVSPSLSEDKKLRVGVLKFGTVSWQLKTVKDNGLDTANGYELNILPLASKNATSIALQAGEADIIVTDWIWALRQRASGDKLVFVPYSTALGALVVGKKSNIKEVKDLKGKRIGIAGGPLDKSWLVLRTWTTKNLGYDIADHAELIYAAPPILTEQIRNGGVDVALNFWPYVARLEAEGYSRLTDVDTMLKSLDIESPPPLVGYVFREEFAASNSKLIKAFVKSIAGANKILATSDEAWDKIRPVMKAESDKAYKALRAGFRTGIPASLAVTNTDDAGKLFKIMSEKGGDKLLGNATIFDPKVFWSGN